MRTSFSLPRPLSSFLRGAVRTKWHTSNIHAVQLPDSKNLIPRSRFFFFCEPFCCAHQFAIWEISQNGTRKNIVSTSVTMQSPTAWWSATSVHVYPYNCFDFAFFVIFSLQMTRLRENDDENNRGRRRSTSETLFFLTIGADDTITVEC